MVESALGVLNGTSAEYLAVCGTYSFCKVINTISGLQKNRNGGVIVPIPDEI